MDSFRDGRPAISLMIFPYRKLACCVAHRVRSHTQNRVGGHVHPCLMDFRQDVVDETHNLPSSFMEWLVVLTEQNVSLRGYSHQTADECIQDVLRVREVEFHRCSHRDVLLLRDRQSRES